MLLSKTARITPTLVSATASKFIASTTAMPCLQHHKGLSFTNPVLSDMPARHTPNVPKNFITYNTIAPSALTVVRFYANEAKREQATEGAPAPSTPSANLPDREQVERFLFRVLALLWDISVWIFTVTKKAVNTHIVENETVQSFWKRMHERMNKAKKEW